MSFAQPFANYEILARIGAGAMGTVFKARQKHLERIVALKVLKPALARDARYVERLEREARTVARLNHPNIVTAYDLGHEGGYHYFVMEFVEGRSLRQLLAEWGAFPESQVLDVAVQMGGALAHAYECGVIHRDVKPANILIDAEGRAKLTDLGLARAESDLALTRDGATVGTPQYISPEQARNPHDADIRSDLYSLGATLFHMLTGQPPFKADAIGELITKVLHERPPSVVELVPEISDGLSLVVRKLLAKDPLLRYQTPTDLLADLERVARRERPQVDTGMLEAEVAATRSVPRQARRRGGRTGVIVSLAALLAFALGFVVARLSAVGRAREGIAELTVALEQIEPLAARFARLGDLAAGPQPVDAATLAELRARTLATLEARLDEELSAIDGSRRAETVDKLGVEGGWSSADSFVREVVVARLDTATGFRPENIPDARLRQRVTERLATLRNELLEITTARDRTLESGFDRRLHEQVLPQCLQIANAGRPDLAPPMFREANDVQLGKLLSVPVSALPQEMRTRIDEIAGRAAQELDQQLARIRGELAVSARQRFAALVEHFEESGRDLAAEDLPPSAFLHLLATAEQQIDAMLPPREAFSGDARSPWPVVDEWLVGQRIAIDARQARWVARATEQALDLAYEVLPRGGPEVAARVLLGLDDGAPSPRLERHLAVFRRASALRDDLLRAILGDRDRIEFALETARGPETLSIEHTSGGGLALFRASDHRPLGFGDTAFEALLLRPEVGSEVRDRGDAATLLARACALTLSGAPSSAIALLDGDALALFRTDCVSRLRVGDRPVDLAESAAREALDRIALLRERGDAIALRDALSRFEQEHPDAAILRRQPDYLRGLRAWAERHAAREERRLALRERVPGKFTVELGDDESELISGDLGDLPSSCFSAGWSRERGVAEFAPTEGDGSLVSPLRFDSPFARESVDVSLDVELRLSAGGRATRAVVLDLHGIAAVLLVLPEGQVVATALPSSEVDLDAVTARLTDALVDATRGPPRIVSGVWHRVRVGLKREGGAMSARVELDGLDRAPLCRQIVPYGAVDPISIAFAGPQSFALRHAVIVRRGP